MRSTSNTSESIFNNTVLCKFFERGKCSRGHECSFAHGVHALRRKPDLTRTKFCSAFQNGPCPAGKDCAFAHLKTELQRCRPRRVQPPGRVTPEVEVDVVRGTTDSSTSTSASSYMGCGEQQLSLDENCPDQLLQPEARLSPQDVEQSAAMSTSSTSLEAEALLYPSVKNTFLHFEARSWEPRVIHRINTWPMSLGGNE
eukprot:s2345_g9.t1